MSMSISEYSCQSAEHVERRSFLKIAGAAGVSLLTPVSKILAQEHDSGPIETKKSLIVLWMEGAPSQLETFDPHPGTEIAAGSKARNTALEGAQLGAGFEQLADQMQTVSLVRALTSEEGDHSRAIYNIKTGFRPDPTLIHPAIGSVICHQTELGDSGMTDIPRHVSILPGEAAGRGGYLGDQYDAFKINDPKYPVPDIKSAVDRKRQRQRLKDLNVVDRAFRQKHQNNSSMRDKLGHHNLDAALTMMTSEQLEAFNVSNAPKELRDEYGDTAFGRGCLAAVRLIRAGVRCVEITLGGWDSHVNNHELQAGRIEILDPAFAALLRDLKRREMLDSTMVVCGGEFGRTPYLNPVGGRDHWPHGFSVALAGGGIQGGRVIGETSPEPSRQPRKSDLKDSNRVEDLHATILQAMGIEFEKELQTPIGRPMKICEGKPIKRLIEA